ncbi:unnamed protein product [Lampetra planeri]
MGAAAAAAATEKRRGERRGERSREKKNGDNRGVHERGEETRGETPRSRAALFPLVPSRLMNPMRGESTQLRNAASTFQSRGEERDYATGSGHRSKFTSNTGGDFHPPGSRLVL